jgi:hypothetical protein
MTDSDLFSKNRDWQRFGYRARGFRRENDGEAAEKGKGCDIGYALAASSCEGANSVEACTVTALDAITAFAVPNPNCSSQKQSVFSGSDARRVTSSGQSLSLLRTGEFY